MEWQKSEYILIQNMANIMMLKFRKYWTECSMILAVAYVLNPGCKMKFVENYYTEIHGLSSSKTYSDRVVSALYAIYSEYAPPSSSLHTVQASGSHTAREVYSENLASSKAKRMASWYQREGIGNNATKSELEQYLDEPLSPLKGMSILDWWKVNSPKYSNLSKMARDILCIPVSSVPSEAAFSNGGRVLCDSRASLGHNTIEALICGESWIPDLSSPKNILEDFNQLSFADAEDDGGSAAEEGYTTYNDDD